LIQGKPPPERTRKFEQTGESGVESNRPFFADRVYIGEEVDLTTLCLAIIAPVSPGHTDFEFVIAELTRLRPRKMHKAAAFLLKSSVTDFLAGKRSQASVPHRKFAHLPPVSDDHFVSTMFRSFSAWQKTCLL
jgi:hypothetical protein